MPLLEQGKPVTDLWQKVQDDAPLPQGAVIVPLARLAEGLAHDGRLGVALPADADVETLRDALPKLDVIAVHFPIFRDGRAFSQARALRERLRFTGEIRATGHILPDQYEFLIRCGVSTVDVPEGTDLAPWQRALDQFEVAFQPSVLSEAPTGFALRRRLAAR